MRPPARLLTSKALSGTSIECKKDDTADAHVQSGRNVHAPTEPLGCFDGQRLRLTGCIGFAGPSSWLVDRHHAVTLSEDHQLVIEIGAFGVPGDPVSLGHWLTRILSPVTVDEHPPLVDSGPILGCQPRYHFAEQSGGSDKPGSFASTEVDVPSGQGSLALTEARRTSSTITGSSLSRSRKVARTKSIRSGPKALAKGCTASCTR